jgi:hypothetical protein
MRHFGSPLHPLLGLKSPHENFRRIDLIYSCAVYLCLRGPVTTIFTISER